MKKATTLGDTAEHAWMLEFLDRCFPESGGRVNADMQLIMQMCKAEPKCAQVALQSLAQDIRSSGRDDEANAFLRFALGALFTAYVGLARAEGRCGETDLPAELEIPVRCNPEIIACTNELRAIEDRENGQN